MELTARQKGMMAGNFPVLLDEGIEWLEDLAGNVPRFGDHIAWDSSGNRVMNSWVSAIITGTPMIHHLGENPLDCIETGDFVRIDADSGFVEIIKNRGLRSNELVFKKFFKEL